MTETAETPAAGEAEATQAAGAASDASAEPSWYIDDNTPGTGAKPDWMPTQFKRASDIGKSYAELQKKLGAFTGAPENYDLSSLEIDNDQHLVKEITSVAKEMNMSQEGLQKFLGRIASAQEAESGAHLESEVKKLGPDGERMLTELKNWQKDYFNPEENEVISNWIKGADDVKVFNKMMANTKMSSVPTSQSMAMANNFEGVKDLKAELAKNIDRFDKDATYRKDWKSRMSRAVTRNPNS